MDFGLDHAVFDGDASDDDAFAAEHEQFHLVAAGARDFADGCLGSDGVEIVLRGLVRFGGALGDDDDFFLFRFQCCVHSLDGGWAAYG